MNWRLVVTVLLLMGALLSGWSVWTQDHREEAPSTRGGNPDYVLKNFELVVLDALGVESFSLRAPRLFRDPKARTMDILTPHFLIPPGPDSSGDAWEVRAKKGWVSAEGDELQLRGEVRATSSGSSEPAVAIHTEEMNLYLENKQVSSNVEVSINRPGSILRGRGLEADLTTKLYTIKSEVRSRYVPKS